MALPTRICTKCGQEKPELAFAGGQHNKSGLHAACRDCYSKDGKLRRAEQRIQRALRRESFAKTPLNAAQQKRRELNDEVGTNT